METGTFQIQKIELAARACWPCAVVIVARHHDLVPMMYDWIAGRMKAGRIVEGVGPAGQTCGVEVIVRIAVRQRDEVVAVVRLLLRRYHDRPMGYQSDAAVWSAVEIEVGERVAKREVRVDSSWR